MLNSSRKEIDMGAKTEKYTDRDILIRIAEAQEQLLVHFNNGKFVGQLKEGIKEQTRTILAETNIVREDVKEVRGVMNWIRYTAFGIISALIAVDIALIGLYARQILMNK